MSMEWFDRVVGELQDHLESICEKYDQDGQMAVERGSKHPRIEFFVDYEDGEREYFYTLYFDPHNEEFYTETIDDELEQPARVILSDIDDIVDAVHEGFHDYINDDDDGIDIVYSAEDDDDTLYVDTTEDEGIDDMDDELYMAEIVDEDDILEEVDVEWETPEVTAFLMEDDVEVTYQFGLVHDTGDGVLRRVNRIWTEDDELIKDETNFIFTKEEAPTIIAMIASHMDSMQGYDD
ncbi:MULTISPECIES: hypothetical protein [unclassified Bacillus (in: firmicutes)]|uniref:hypothetical protein n=1 Tax=unclassified Bacillus (in: firmicutes) TaxID=185979 RepID=UPI001BEB988F|nr:MULTISPECIES: hypothetical protein [unclassified Bacillus (in: firmicutes)]MBT2639905.1 hypothetical protein [Bacillus sp. ISL-39]MBT2663626.1 hypothetical protein [Bacillus sp. ISL-45]